MNKKALSPIFTTVILIAIAIIAGIVVYMFTSNSSDQFLGNQSYFDGKAPNGIYQQGDWGIPGYLQFSQNARAGGWIDNATTWLFSTDGPGPLHGEWSVANGTWMPIWASGVFPIHARLYVYIENNTIVGAEVRSQFKYGG